MMYSYGEAIEMRCPMGTRFSITECGCTYGERYFINNFSYINVFDVVMYSIPFIQFWIFRFSLLFITFILSLFILRYLYVLGSLPGPCVATTNHLTYINTQLSHQTCSNGTLVNNSYLIRYARFESKTSSFFPQYPFIISCSYGHI